MTSVRCSGTPAKPECGARLVIAPITLNALKDGVLAPLSVTFEYVNGWVVRFSPRGGETYAATHACCPACVRAM